MGRLNQCLDRDRDARTRALTFLTLLATIFITWRDRRSSADAIAAAQQRFEIEQKRADERLARQQQHADEQLAAERERADRQLAAERAAKVEQDQWAEARLVEVHLEKRTQSFGDGAGRENLVATILNRGQTIDRVDLEFKINGSTVGYGKSQLRGDPCRPQTSRPFLRTIPANHFAIFESGTDTRIAAVYGVLLEWSDRWGVRWRHSDGKLERVTDPD